MSRKTILTAALTILMIVIWNGWILLDWNSRTAAPVGDGETNPFSTGLVASSTINSQEPQLWQDIKKTIVNESPEIGFDPQFDESVLALDGKEVELPGVGFLLSSGLRESFDGDGEEEVTEFLLLPSHGGVAWCCGLSPIAHHEFSVLVDCHDAPFSAADIDPRSPAFFVNVNGTLRLQQDNTLNALYTLENVSIEFIDIEDILPENVMNLCRNQRMTPQDLIRHSNPQQGQQPIGMTTQDSR